MKSTDVIQPAAISQPIANQGTKFNIPEEATGSELASIAEGFPDITMKALEDGGKPPRGQDCNGMFYLSTDQRVFLQNGGLITFNQDVSDTIGGYPSGAVLCYVTDEKLSFVKSLIDDNTNNFVTNPEYIDDTHWKEYPLGGSGSGSGLPLLSIRIAFYVDESLGLDYYLNGQLLTVNSNLQGAVNELKKLKAIRPSLFVTEEEWQATKTLSPNGIVNAFVLDEDAGTLRLPKYPDYIYGGSENAEISVSGNGYGLGLTPDGSNLFMLSKYGGDGNDTNSRPSGPHGAPVPVGGSAGAMGGGYTNIAWGVHPDPAKSGLKGQLTDNTEKITLKYVIRLATGQETEVNITNEIELNNPFFFGMSQYFDVEPNNLSWLKSDGMYKPKSVYPDYYNWISENVNKGVEGFKGQEGYCFIATDSSGYYWWVSTESPVVGASVYRYDVGVNSMFFDGTVETLTSDGFTFTSIFEGSSYTVTRDSSKDTSILHPAAWITDNDFEINTSVETFRLPLLDGSECLVSDRYIDLTLQASGTKYTAVANGFVFFEKLNTSNTQFVKGTNLSSGYADISYGTYSGSTPSILLKVKRGDIFSIDYDAAGVTNSFRFIYARGNGSLYYYVGETVQNANLIDAGRMAEFYATKQFATSASLPSHDYVELTIGAPGSTYTAPANGWYELSGIPTHSTNNNILLWNTNTKVGTQIQGITTVYAVAQFIPCTKGNIIEVNYTNYSFTAKGQGLRFIYAQGSQGGS